MIGKVQAIAKGGAGVIREPDKTVFVPGVIVGETVEYAPLSRRQSAWQGKLLRVLDASPQRVEPPCPHYEQCGGCNLQHMSYEEQLRSKSGILLANLKKIAGLVPAVTPGIFPSPPWRYRSKSEFQIRAGASGFFQKESQRVVAIDRCLLVPETVEAFFLAQRQALGRCANAQLQVVSNGRELAARLLMADGRHDWLSREREVHFAVAGYAYRIAPDNFIQPNLFQLQPMLGLLEKTAAALDAATAADLFCGCGFFTMPLAARCRHVLALENDGQNLAALRRNLERNRAGNVQVVPADVLQAELPAAGLVVVDPPRGGLSARVIAALTGGGTETIVYFSCDSATLARDLRLFAGRGFALQELQLLDNFPQTDHFETFAVLKKTN